MGDKHGLLLSTGGAPAKTPAPTAKRKLTSSRRDAGIESHRSKPRILRED
jgi:hypothetical protein